MVHKPNPVRSVSQQPQQFTTPAVQQFQSQPARQVHQPFCPPVPPQPEPARPADDLAEEIYVRLVAGQYLDSNYSTKLEAAHLRELARAAQLAATTYFQTLEESTNNG